MQLFLQFIFGIELYMFRTGFLSIVRSFSLYTQQRFMSYSTKLLMMDRKPVRNM